METAPRPTIRDHPAVLDLARTQGALLGLIEQSTSAVFVKDLWGRYVMVNALAAAQIGRPREAIIGAFDAELYPPATAQEIVWNDSIVMDSGRARTAEELVETPSGLKRILSTKGVYRDRFGRIAGLYGLSQDVTEQRFSEQALQFLASASRVLPGSLDVQRIFAELARLAVPFLGDWCVVYARTDEGALEVRAVAHEDDRQIPMLTATAREIASRWPSAVLEADRAILYPPPVKSAPAPANDAFLQTAARWLRVRALLCIPLHAQGRAIGLATLGTQTSRYAYSPMDAAVAEELVRSAALALENARLYQEARDAIATRDEFLATVSHDLKGPLVAIKALSQLAARRVSKGQPEETDPVLDELSTIDATTDRMTGMIDELLDVALLQLGQPLQLNLRALNLLSVVQSEIIEQQRAITPHQIALDSGDGQIMGLWDSTRLRRVLGNLVANAAKYSPSKSTIHVSVARERDRNGDWAIIVVQDQGVGIPAADLPHVFRRFHRGANVAGRVAGSGIGLVSAQHIVEQHGGTIHVVSQEGGGIHIYRATPRPHYPDPAEKYA